MSITSDRNDPGLHQKRPDGQNESYLVLSDEERAKGFVAPYRDTYVHEKCKVATKMGRALSETYARDPKFYGSTFCVGCGTHFPVAEFKWDDGDVVGSIPEPRTKCKHCKYGGEVKIIEYFTHLEKHIADKEEDIECAQYELRLMNEEMKKIRDNG